MSDKLKKAVVLIPARAGSKRCPNKNLLALDNVPLFEIAARQGLAITSDVYISTDIDKILKSQTKSGLTLVRRPAALATDSTPMEMVISHFVDEVGIKNRTIVLLQPTSPLRLISDIRGAINMFDSDNFDLVQSVAETAPGILKCGFVDPKTSSFNPVSKMSYCFSNAQELPQVFQPNGAIYVFNSENFKNNGGLNPKKVGAFVMSKERSLDIDNVEDFNICNLLITSRKLELDL